MRLKMLTDVQRGNIELKKGESFEVEDVIQDTYKIKVSKKQKNKFTYVLVNDGDGVLVNNQ